MKYYSHNICKDVEVDLSQQQWDELRDLYVERIVDNMSTKDLVAYVTDDMSDYVKKLSDVEFLEECKNYWDDDLDEILEEVREVSPDKVDSIHQRRELDALWYNQSLILLWTSQLMTFPKVQF